MPRSQTNRPGQSQTPHPQGVPYVTAELMPQGVVLSQSPRGAAMYIVNTNPQQPLYGMGLTSASMSASQQLIPGQGPIDRGY
jgi:hypothetical protein